MNNPPLQAVITSQKRWSPFTRKQCSASDFAPIISSWCRYESIQPSQDLSSVPIYSFIDPVLVWASEWSRVWAIMIIPKGPYMRHSNSRVVRQWHALSCEMDKTQYPLKCMHLKTACSFCQLQASFQRLALNCASINKPQSDSVVVTY